MYKIVKNGRLSTDSYIGPTWDIANLRHRCKLQYASYKEAQELADKLTEFNQVGYHVEVMSNMKAIIYYTDYEDDPKCKEFPIYSKVDFTLENILKLREVTGNEVIITDTCSLPLWDSQYQRAFTKEELEDHRRNPKSYIVLEVYNGYRE